MPSMGTAEWGLRGTRILDTLRLLGYGPDFVERDFTVWLGDRQADADVVAFSMREPKDMSTAALVIEVLSTDERYEHAWDQAATLGQTLAAPLVGVADATALALAVVAADGSTSPLVSISYERPLVSTELLEQLSPRHILEMKTGSRQPALFPIDVSLLENARQKSEERLAPRVENALVAAFEHLGYGDQSASESDPPDRSHQRAARLVVGALTALVLRDKEGLSNLPPGALVDVVAQRHPSEFAWIQHLEPRELDGLTGVVAGLGADISFRGLDPVILSGVYESTLVTDVRRRQLGTHYTSPGLARRMLAELPIENLAPGERSVLDPTCGSGGLLLAAHDRLRSLQPAEWDLAQSHRDLAEHLTGYDTDAFAVEIARLSLLLHAMPAGNGWDVRHEDALTVSLLEPDQPGVIVANPPWRNTNTAKGRRVETADEFLQWMLVHIRPRGLLAVVMPIGWLQNRSSREARASLHRQCDVFEVWRLPKGTFEPGNMAPAVLFARKRESPPSSSARVPVLFRRAYTRADLDAFYRGNADSETYLADSDLISGESPLLAGPLTTEFRHRDYAELASVVNVVAGPQPKSGYVPRPESESNCQYLPYLRHMPPFGQPALEALQFLRFPDDFQAGRGAVGLGRRKVLVPAASGPDTPWRLRSSIDLRGILVRNSMQMVIPHDDDENLLYGLMAFLGSAFASCWIDERAMERNVSTSAILSIPIPSRERDWHRLSRFGRDLFAVTGHAAEARELARRLDVEVWNALEVPQELQIRLIHRLSGRSAPESGFRYAAMRRPSSGAFVPRGRPRSRYGVVHAVEAGRILVEVPGITSADGVWLEPPPGLPGALCVAGATFDVSLQDDGSLADAKFSYQPESWVDTDTLLKQPAYHAAAE